MQITTLMLITGVLACATQALALEAVGVVKRVDAQSGSIVVFAGGADRTLRTAADTQFLDTDLRIAYLGSRIYGGWATTRLKPLCRGRVTLYGNLDCGNVLSFGAPQSVAEHVTACLEAGRGGGHILCAGNAITAAVPMTNYLAAVNAYRKTFSLPPFVHRDHS